MSGLFKSAGQPKLSTDVNYVRSGVARLASLWPSVWGKNKPGGVGTTPVTPPPLTPPAPITPGAIGSFSISGPSAPNLQPEATMGGPGSSVTGAGRMGFAGGGLVMPTLRDVAGQFGILVPGGNGYMPVALPDAMGRGISGASKQAAGAARSLSEAGAAQSRIGVNVAGDVVITNPVPERPSDSITRSSSRLALLAGRGA